jgi:UDP-N-acetyl-D-glucosamine dehydrogenase
MKKTGKAEAFRRRLDSHEAVVGIIGLGYVGLPLMRAFCDRNFRVLGFDTDPHKIKQINKGKSYIKNVATPVIAKAVNAGLFSATGDYRRLKEVDAIIICVPTPLNKMREPDLSYVENTCRDIAKNLKKGQLVVLESTTYPGTTDEVVKPMLETSGLKCGRDFYLAFSPEREDAGNPKYSAPNIPKVVGGSDEQSLEMASALYSRVVVRVIPVSSTRAAEACKMLENIYRCVNIALVNELKMLFDKMGIDVWEVIEAASTKPFGFQPFYPGPGLGGHCIPIDPFYLLWKAREYNFTTKFIELAGQINTSMPQYVIAGISRALNERGKAISGSKILLLGMAYKKDVDDCRESPALEIATLLTGLGARVSYHDPYVPALHKMRGYNLKLKSVPLSDKRLAGTDCVVIVTDHSRMDYARVVRLAPLVIDTRNATKDVTEHREKIIKC